MTETTEDVRQVAVTAREAIDTAKAKAKEESGDGLFQVWVPAFDAYVVFRRLNFAEAGTINSTAKTADQSTSLMIKASLVQPAFSSKEIDEIMTDPDLFSVAVLLNNAVRKINHVGEDQEVAVLATFQRGK